MAIYYNLNINGSSMVSFDKSGFAVIRQSGKQYKVHTGCTVSLDRIPGNPGDKIALQEVLMIGEYSRASIIGSPTIKGATVMAEIIDQTRDPKVIIFKKKRRQNYRRKNGYRHEVTQLKILEINKAQVG
jgi:large subunit ribosomal protein L21